MGEIGKMEEYHPDEELGIEISKLPPIARILFQSLIKQNIPREEALKHAMEVYSKHMQNVPADKPPPVKPPPETPGK